MSGRFSAGLVTLDDALRVIETQPPEEARRFLAAHMNQVVRQLVDDLTGVATTLGRYHAELSAMPVRNDFESRLYVELSAFLGRS